jgi:processive 1,2-diacylglycerol beta-glucosyltransferase
LQRKKRVLILSEGFGAGHTQAAHALAVSIKRMSPSVQTRVLELGSFLHPTIFPLIFNAYKKTVTSQPKLYGMVYRSQYKKKIGRLSQLALHRIFYAQTAHIIRTLKPNAIVCTHPFPNIVVSRLKRSAGLDIPLCTVITDYDAHGTWVSAETNRYLVSTPEVKNKLISRGISSRIIRVTGIPVHPNFYQHQDKDQVREQFGLKPMPTVLVMGGGWGLMKQEELLKYMVAWRDQIQFIFVLGNNQKARDEMEEDPAFAHENIKLIGFTREVDKLMEISDLLITKPGGMTCTEALAKGLPMLFHEAIPGQEEENAQYFTSNGFGEQLKSVETIDYWFNRLVLQYGDVLHRRRMLTQMLQKYNPEDCSRAIIQMVN